MLICSHFPACLCAYIDFQHLPTFRMRIWLNVKRDNHCIVSKPSPRRLGPQELVARRKSVTDALAGLRITPELEVSDQLINECVAMLDKNRLK